MEIDEKDMILLKMLKENSRLSLKKMARELRVSETAVKKRIEKLKSRGVIKKFTVDINERAIGFSRAFVFLYASDAEKAADFIRKLPFVSSVCFSSGRYNLVVEMEGPETLVCSIFERIKKLGCVKKAYYLTVVRWF